MTYLSRQVFTLAINWEENPKTDLAVEIPTVQVGQAEPRLERHEEYTGSRWDVEVPLETTALIVAYDAFMDLVHGTRIGFWLPVPWSFAVVLDHDTTAYAFEIVDNGLFSRWQDNPDQHLYFLSQDGTAVAAKVTKVGHALSAAAVASGGTGYAVDDILDLGSAPSGGEQAQVRVTAVSGGVVTAVSVETDGAYLVTPANPVSTTGGSGTGCTITATWTTGERVTVDTDKSAWDGHMVHRLAFVRLASDSEEGNYLAEGFQVRLLSCVELPTEYTTAHAGEVPVWLYQFTQDYGNDTEVVSRYTSFDIDLTDDIGNVWTSYPISHAQIEMNVTGDQEEVDLQMWYDPSHPVSKMIPFAVEVPIQFSLYRATYAQEERAQGSVLVFSGTIENASSNGRRMRAMAQSWLDTFARRVPRMLIQPRCNNDLFGPQCDPGGTLKTAHSKACTLTQATAPNQLTAGGAALSGMAANYLAGGWVDTGTGSDRERRTILANTAESGGTVTLTINWPLNNLTPAQAATAYPGCLLSVDDCQNKFNNFTNFGGMPNIPKRNLTLQAVPTGPGGKK